MLSELINRLIPEGAVMAGNTPKTILADDSGGGSEPGYYDTTGLGNVLRKMMVSQAKKQAEQEKLLKRRKDQTDMYRTLRDSGYDPKAAYEAVLANSLPKEPGGETTKEKESNAKVAKLGAETDKINKQTDILTHSGAGVRQRIIDKVAEGEELTAGEQKIYDEVIRKYGQKSDLNTVLQKKADKIDNKNKGDYVAMVDPIGRKKLVPKANVEKAKAKGWKLR